MTKNTPPLPPSIRAFRHARYETAHMLAGLEGETKLFSTETLFGDWDGETLLLAKDAAPSEVLRRRIKEGDPSPWRHADRERGDKIGVQTNEGVVKIANLLAGRKLYGSALGNLLRNDGATSGSLPSLDSVEIRQYITQLLAFVVANMPNLSAIVCLGQDAYSAACANSTPARSYLKAGESCEASMFGRDLLIGHLKHPSRPFKGGWLARNEEWIEVANSCNARLRTARPTLPLPLSPSFKSSFSTEASPDTKPKNPVSL